MARLAEEEKERKRLAQEEKQKLIDKGLWDPDDDAEEGENRLAQLSDHILFSSCPKDRTTESIWTCTLSLHALSINI